MSKACAAKSESTHPAVDIVGGVSTIGTTTTPPECCSALDRLCWIHPRRRLFFRTTRPTWPKSSAEKTQFGDSFQNKGVLVSHVRDAF